MNGHALRPEDEKIGRFGIDESDAPLRRNQFSEVSDTSPIGDVAKMKPGLPMPSAAI